MPDIEPLTFPSREGIASQQDQADLHAVCSGRRRTYALLNSPLPCVYRAVYHIQEMRSLIKNCHLKHFGKYNSKRDQNKHHYSKISRIRPQDSDSDSYKDLFVEGIAISAIECRQRSPLQKKVDDVITEVVCLIERLEADRQSAEEALQKEKRRKKILEGRFNNISRWKLTEHPANVQKEHDACSREIAELKFQLELERQKVCQIQDKLSHAEENNQRLQDDIIFTRKQVNSVREKVDTQRGIMNETEATKAKVERIFHETKSKLFLVQSELKEMKTEFDKEKTTLDHEVQEIQSQLALKLDDLSQSQLVEKDLVAKTKEAEETIALTEDKSELITQHFPETLKLEKVERDMISRLCAEIEELEQKGQLLKEKLAAEREEIEKKKNTWEGKVSCIQAKLSSKQEAFELLCKKNLEYEQQVKDHDMRFRESEKAVKQMQEQKKLMLQKITDNVELWEKVKEEVTQVGAQHSDVTAKLEKQEQLTFMEEQAAKIKVESLKKDLAAYANTLELLKGQTVSINDELTKYEKHSEKTNQQLQEQFEESSSAAKALEDKMNKITNLAASLDKLKFDHAETLLSLKKEHKMKCTEIKAAQDLHCSLMQRYENTITRITDLTKECEEYQEASNRTEKQNENMPGLIADLQKEFKVLQFKNKSASLIMSTLQSEFNNCQQRAQRSMQTRMAHLTARKKRMEETEDLLKAALIENKQLANDYDDLKKKLLGAKEEALSALTKKTQTETTFNYYTELSLLQKRMRRVLVKYLEQRGLCSLADLERCQALYRDTTQKIQKAQEELCEEIHPISAFLQSPSDKSAPGDDAGAEVNELMPSVQETA